MRAQSRSRLIPELRTVDRALTEVNARSAFPEEISESSRNYHEDQLAKIRLFEELDTTRKTGSGSPTLNQSAWPPAAHGTRFCAYDRTRERFLSNQVDACDSNPLLLEVRLENFVPGSGAALWLAPVCELPLTIFRFPVDLVLLDRNYVVIDAVESFPLSSSGPSIASAASVLILTARTISSIGLQSGDQLILCGPEEMEMFLSQPRSKDAQLTAPSVAIQSIDSNFPGEASVQENRPHTAGGDPLKVQDQLTKKPAPERAPREAVFPEAGSSSAVASSDEVLEERQVQYSRKKSWWRRFLAGEPPDPREADRESIPGLIAYFFTGGAPIVHRVRDISTNGIYVFTNERWYPDTVVRITLSDEREPSRETTLTVHARVARGDKNGVGLQFVLTDKRTQEQNIPAIGRDQEIIVTKEQVEAFVKRFKSSRG